MGNFVLHEIFDAFPDVGSSSCRIGELICFKFKGLRLIVERVILLITHRSAHCLLLAVVTVQAATGQSDAGDRVTSITSNESRRWDDSEQ